MINQISNYILKTYELENEIENLKENIESSSTPNCLCLNQNFSNLEIIFPKKIFVTQIDTAANSAIFFQGQVEINSNAKLDITVSFIVNANSIQKIEKTLFPGNNIIPVFCNFTSLSSEKLDIYLKIEQKNNIAVYLQSLSLFVWGTLKNETSPRYQVLELEDSYLLSLLYNQKIYSKIVPKQTYEYSFDELTLGESALAYSFCYVKRTGKTYLFYVDLSQNLYGCDTITSEFLIEKNVTDVSAISIGDEVFIFFIQDGYCYEIVMDKNENLSLKKKINVANLKFERVTCYASYKSENLFLILTDKNNSNYLLTQCDESSKNIDNIKASYSILIETSGGV